jgi:transposase InsO family protein
MRTELVEDALTAARATRGSLAGAIFHSDHGSAYASAAYARLCAGLGITQSMGAVGTSADNSLAEAFNATLKREVLQDLSCWPDEATCRRQLFRWLVRYNTRRRHSWCRYQSPINYENNTPLRSRQRRKSHPVSKNRGKAQPHVLHEPGSGPDRSRGELHG